MTPQQIAASFQTLSAGQRGDLSHADLYNARSYMPRNQQSDISPYEHRAFAKEATRENPLLALPIAVGSLAYQPYKMLAGKSRSGPALNQIGYGLAGVGEGLWGAFQDQSQSTKNRIASIGKGMPTTGLLESLQSYLQGSNKANTHRQ